MYKKHHYADAHLDLALDIQKQRELGRNRVIESDYLDRFEAGGFGVIVSSIFVQNSFIPEMALRVALRQISALKSDIRESERVEFCTEYSDVIQAIENRRVGIMLSMEDCIPLYNDIELLPLMYELGVRFMGLAWNRRNMACDGSAFVQNGRSYSLALTPFGQELVKSCIKYGIVIDVSHLNAAGFWDLCNITDGPIIASHSNAAAIVPTERNLTDEQIREISVRKGYIGINGMSFLISGNESDACVENMVDHITHIAEIAGTDCIGLGLDMNDSILKHISESEKNLVPGQCRDVIPGHDKILILIDEMKKRGFSENETDKICGGNFLRILKENF